MSANPIFMKNIAVYSVDEGALYAPSCVSGTYSASCTVGEFTVQVVAGVSTCVLLHPGHVAVHPALEKGFTLRADIAAGIEKAFLNLQKGLGLP